MKPKNKISSNVGVWIAIGIGIGGALGLATRDLGMWIGVFVLIGLVISGGLKPKRRV
jgi:hypothetical protein